MRSKRDKLTWDKATGLIAQHTEETVSSDLVRDPLVSVSLVTYNHAEYVAQALDSVLEQNTSFPFEILVGDDGSTDETRRIVQSYQQAHPQKIRLFRSTKRLGEYTGNGRLNLVRNLNAARGRFVALLEGDDYWCDPDKLTLQTAFLLSQPDYAGTFHNTDTLENGRRTTWREFGDQLDFSQKDIIAPFSPFHTSSFLFHRKACQVLPNTEMLLAVQSFDMAWFTCVNSTGPLRRIDRTMSVYRKHEGSITNRPSHQDMSMHLERYAMWKNLSDMIDPLNERLFRRTLRYHRVAAEKTITSLSQLRSANRTLSRTLPLRDVRWFDWKVAQRWTKSAVSRFRPQAVVKSWKRRLGL